MQDEQEIRALLMRELSVTRRTVRMAQLYVDQILQLGPELDAQIRAMSTAYAFERIQTVERVILRLALYEMLHDEAVPPKVAISEAIRLARKFSTPAAALFVNAILDGIYQASLGKTADSQRLSQICEVLSGSEEAAAQAAMEERDVSFADRGEAALI
jgi:N utilization substance protein B